MSRGLSTAAAVFCLALVAGPARAGLCPFAMGASLNVQSFTQPQTQFIQPPVFSYTPPSPVARPVWPGLNGGGGGGDLRGGRLNPFVRTPFQFGASLTTDFGARVSFPAGPRLSFPDLEGEGGSRGNSFAGPRITTDFGARVPMPMAARVSFPSLSGVGGSRGNSFAGPRITTDFGARTDFQFARITTPLGERLNLTTGSRITFPGLNGPKRWPDPLWGGGRNPWGDGNCTPTRRFLARFRGVNVVPVPVPGLRPIDNGRMGNSLTTPARTTGTASLTANFTCGRCHGCPSIPAPGLGGPLFQGPVPVMPLDGLVNQAPPLPPLPAVLPDDRPQRRQAADRPGAARNDPADQPSPAARSVRLHRLKMETQMFEPVLGPLAPGTLRRTAGQTSDLSGAPALPPLAGDDFALRLVGGLVREKRPAVPMRPRPDSGPPVSLDVLCGPPPLPGTAVGAQANPPGDPVVQALAPTPVLAEALRQPPPLPSLPAVWESP
jgi:hypothetical protein